MSLLATINPIIRSVFSRWTALRIAVSHSMGGPESEAKYEAFIDAFGEYLVRNIRSPSAEISLNENDIQEYLDEVLDEEFNTILEDDSSRELSYLFIRYVNLILQGKLNEVQQELQQQQSTVSSMPISMQKGNDDDDSSSSDESEDDMIEEEAKAEKPKAQSMEIDEDGWTTVHRRNSGKK